MKILFLTILGCSRMYGDIDSIEKELVQIAKQRLILSDEEHLSINERWRLIGQCEGLAEAIELVRVIKKER